MRRIAVIVAAFSATFAGSAASACTFLAVTAIDVHYTGVAYGSPQEGKLDLARARDRYARLRGDARRGRIGDPRDFAGNIVNSLVPPIVPGALQGIDICGSGPSRDGDPAGYLPASSFEEAFEARSGTKVDHRYGGAALYDLTNFMTVSHRCNGEFRIAVARELAARASKQDLAVVWGELWAHDLGYGPLQPDNYNTSMRLMRFTDGRKGPLVPFGPGLPEEPHGRQEALKPLLERHFSAMSNFLMQDPAARRVISGVDAIIAEIEARPGGQERYCPAAMAYAQRLVDQVKNRSAAEATGRH